MLTPGSLAIPEMDTLVIRAKAWESEFNEGLGASTIGSSHILVTLKCLDSKMPLGNCEGQSF